MVGLPGHDSRRQCSGGIQALGLADDVCGWSPNTVTKIFCTILNTPSTPNPARNERAEAEKATPPPLSEVVVVPAPEGVRKRPIHPPVMTPSTNGRVVNLVEIAGGGHLQR
jgi:hypothetical protein